MEVELSKENICINKLIAEKKELVIVEEDMIVPDTKPDILNTINVSGNVCVFKKEVIQDKVKIEGNVNTYVMYLPDSKEDNVRALNCTMDFSQNISVPGAKEGMILVTKCEIKDIECKVINGRKISLKANLEIFVKLYANEDIEIINSVKNVQDIQTLNKEFQVNSLIGNGKTTIYAKDTLNIDQQDELAEILSVDIKLCNKDLKLSYNKVLTKAEVKVKITYLTEDNKVKSIEGTIPAVGFIDIQNISEDNICEVHYEVKNMLVKANPAEEHSIYIELEIEPSCMAYEKKNIALIQDLYTPSANLEYTQRSVILSSDKSEYENEFVVKEKVNIPNLTENNIVDVETNTSISNVVITDSKITYTGDLNLNFLYTSGNTLNSRYVKIPFELNTENRQNNADINVDYEIVLKEIKYDFKSNGDVQIEALLEIDTKICRNINMNIIDNIKVEDINDRANDDYDSLILYIVRQGDTLWKIAKKFNSTVEEISRMNGIEDTNKIDVGEKLYIPKFNYIKREAIQNVTEPTLV